MRHAAQAAGAIIPYFFLHWSENITGFAAFGLAACGLVIRFPVGKRKTGRDLRSETPRR
jgi:hypothetical protein